MRPAPLCIMVLSGVFAATAAMAAATTVNIADPNATSRVAKVEVGNRLAVQEVSPATYYHTSPVGAAGTCSVIAYPPTGKALIVRQVRINVSENPTPGSGQEVIVEFGSFSNNQCSYYLAHLNPPTIGPLTVTFDPGVAVPQGDFLAGRVTGSVVADFTVDGYKVDTSVAPQAGGQTIQVLGKPRQ